MRRSIAAAASLSVRALAVGEPLAALVVRPGLSAAPLSSCQLTAAAALQQQQQQRRRPAAATAAATATATATATACTHHRHYSRWWQDATARVVTAWQHAKWGAERVSLLAEKNGRAYQAAAALVNETFNRAKLSPEEAKQQLQAELSRLLSSCGDTHPATALVYKRLSELHFELGEYTQAVDTATPAVDAWTKLEGPHSETAAVYGIQLGKALLGAGVPGDARPWLAQGAQAAWEQYEAELNSVVPRLKEAQQLLAAGKGSDQLAARQAAAMKQRITAKQLIECTTAEALFYAALSAVLHNRSEIEQGWTGTKRKGSQFYFGREATIDKNLGVLLHNLKPDGPTVTCALREHSRVVAACKPQHKLRRALSRSERRLAQQVADARKQMTAAAAALAAPAQKLRWSPKA